jgi:putative membrane protein
MKNFSSYFVSLALAAACFACNNSQPDSTKDAKDTNAVKMDSSGTADHTTPTIPASVSKDDATFVVNTADAGMTEVQLGQLAQQKGKDKDVKMYGAMMEKDHTAAGDKLKAVATSKNITLPASVSADMQKAIDNLQQKNGSDFDKAYISQMIDDHKKVISMFETESKNGSDADIKAFADSTLPKLRMHLEKAQECHKMMKKM